jgi:hypothetical protein
MGKKASQSVHTGPGLFSSLFAGHHMLDSTKEVQLDGMGGRVNDHSNNSC